MNPVAVDDIDLAFGGKMKELLPPMTAISEEFRRGRTKWNGMFHDFFYHGATGLKFFPKEGIDPKVAWRHMLAIMNSFEPQHEHKEAACAWLMSLWFDDIKYTPTKEKTS